jgi:hypothetical protein
MQLAEFILAAKAATYAAQGDEASVAPVLADSKQLEYRDGAWHYRDIYVGMFRFVGQEIVYRDQQAIWSMAYSGGLSDGVDRGLTRPVYAHLRKALLQAPLALPLRGPAVLENGSMRYTCDVDGTLDGFHGVERIFQGGILVYVLRFSGGHLE